MTENPHNGRDCWLCGADIPRVCWCHDPSAAPDGRPCRCPCYRPTGHDGTHGEPLNQDEEDTAMLYGRCGPFPEPMGIINA